MRNTLFFLLLLPFVFLSCEREAGLENGEDEGQVSTRTSLSVSPTDIQLGRSGGRAHISVKSNTSWTVFVNNGGSGVTGLSASPLSGKGNGTIELKYGTVDTEFYQESAVIVFMYELSPGISHNKTVTVHRKRL
ncbi:hypothetical protein [Petrimonas sp.]|uniref:hypothetical protein n=1 Tax=Petrimonas sp. TaxID=2023866 RepID=UPI002FC588D4